MDTVGVLNGLKRMIGQATGPRLDRELELERGQRPMDGEKMIDIDGLKRVSEELFQGAPVLFAYLFGSFAKGNPHVFSDIDVAVFIDEFAKQDRTRLSLDLSLALEAK